MLLERERFPRPHIGESLLPASLAVLERVGVLEQIQSSGFVVKNGATMSWGKKRDPWTWYFAETNDRFPHSYQVERAKFDQILLNHARSVGVDAREEHEVLGVEFDGECAVGVTVRSNGQHESMDAAFVVDASGQRSLIANQVDEKQWDTFFQNIAVYGYFTGAEHLSGVDSGNIFIEAVRNGWIWKIPLANDVSSVGIVVDRDTAAERVRRVGRHEYFLDELNQSRYVAGFLSGATLDRAPVATRDWSYRAKSFAGPAHCLVGDAACFIDPLFSTGVHLALTGAHFAAAYAKTVLTNADLGMKSRVAFQQLYTQQYEHFHDLVRLFYSGNRTESSYFWETRRLTRQEALSPREAFVRAVSGQSAAGYERSVLHRAELPVSFENKVEETTQDRKAATLELRSLGSSVLDLKFRKAAGVRLSAAAVLGDGEFEDGYLVSQSSRDDFPVSPFVAILLNRCDGQRSARAIADDLGERTGAQQQTIYDLVAASLESLYVEGVIETEDMR